MSLLFYNIFIRLYYCGICMASLWNPKAKLWWQGRQNLWKELQGYSFVDKKTIWFHIASFGEFEQAQPLLQQLRSQYANHFFVITFFSPSAYEKIKHRPVADAVFYLPLDTAKNMQRIVSILQPQLVIVIKYEYWYHLLNTLHQRNIPVILVSAIFFKQQVFFRWYGALHRKMLTFFTLVFTQNLASKKLLQTLHLPLQIEVAGDTRFERVMQNYEHMKLQQFDWVKPFQGNNSLVVIGSSWHKDESLFADIQKKLPHFKFIIAPHEVDIKHIQQVQQQFPNSLLYSKLSTHTKLHTYQNIIIDTIGILSQLYFYADIVYVGGGFKRSGIHNILEAAVFGKAIIIGPRFSKFQEALDLHQLNAIFSISNASELLCCLQELSQNESLKKTMSLQCQNFVHINIGASKIITDKIYEKRLLRS